MKFFSQKIVYITALVLALGFITLQTWPKKGQGLGVERFSLLPAQQNGRIKPLDTIARTSLLAISGHQTLKTPIGPSLDASTWLLLLATTPGVADQIPTFRIDHPQLRALIQAPKNDKYLSYEQLFPYFESIRSAHDVLPENKEGYGPYEKAIDALHKNLTLYHRLVHSFRPYANNPSDVISEYSAWLSLIPQGIQAINAQAKGESFNNETLDAFIILADRYLSLSKTALLGIVPPEAKDAKNFEWANIGQALLDGIPSRSLSPVVTGYAALAEAAQQKEPILFEEALSQLETSLYAASLPWKLKLEVFFNQWMPFYQAMSLYVFAFLLVLMSWLFSQTYFEKPANAVMILAFLLHTSGIIVRMVIQGRPPITSLYASSLFVGWASVALSLALERTFRQGLGIAVGSLIGFSTLLIAHHLSGGEDTLEMVRAVLDANFWLSTHVVMVTLGYSAMFLAGGLAMLCVFKSYFKNALTSEKTQSLLRMIYGVLCFGLFFSFVGTLLGGIWADQSWGRFWGWDPKENGALLIVLWGAIVLHMRLAKMIGPRGLILSALFGNILTSWSWFGTNMLSVGLHSYGFMDRAFWSLAAFIALQLIFMALGWYRPLCKSTQ